MLAYYEVCESVMTSTKKKEPLIFFYALTHCAKKKLSIVQAQF